MTKGGSPVFGNSQACKRAALKRLAGRRRVKKITEKAEKEVDRERKELDRLVSYISANGCPSEAERVDALATEWNLEALREMKAEIAARNALEKKIEALAVTLQMARDFGTPTDITLMEAALANSDVETGEKMRVKLERERETVNFVKFANEHRSTVMELGSAEQQQLFRHSVNFQSKKGVQSVLAAIARDQTHMECLERARAHVRKTPGHSANFMSVVQEHLARLAECKTKAAIAKIKTGVNLIIRKDKALASVGKESPLRAQILKAATARELTTLMK